MLFSKCHKVGWIADHNFEHSNKVGWNRNSRTDRGVHSLSTIVSAKLEIQDLDESMDQINKVLPKDIQVFSIQRASKGAHFRTETSWREYEV
jgi:tRNA pseudouridine38-40 synthase